MTRTPGPSPHAGTGLRAGPRAGTPRALLLGIGVPTLVLAIGWFAASWRERQVLAQQERATVDKSAELVQSVVDASLAELRAREDKRPYDHYNHVYTPNDVVALSDALAISPLAGVPADARIKGYVQIDPDGSVRTPVEPTSVPLLTALAADLRAFGASAAAAPLREQARAAPVQIAARTIDESAGTRTAQPSIQALNQMQNAVFAELEDAQAPGPPKSALVGKRLPTTGREDVDYSVGTRGFERGKLLQKQAPPNQASPPPQQQAEAAGVAAVATVVAYTPFVFDHLDGVRVLSRVVSLGESRAVQVVVLDERVLREEWLRELITKLVVKTAPPRVISTEAETSSCTAVAPVSAALDDLALCFPAGQAQGAPWLPFVLQLGFLILLVAVVALAMLYADRAAVRAEALAQQRARFIAAVSHELRTPLTTLRMHAEMLRDNLVSPGKRPQFFDDMVNESRRLSQLVENVLEAVRMEEGRRPLHPEDTDLGAQVHAIVQQQRPFFEQRGLTLEEENAAVHVQVDAQALEQIVVNLLENAAKYGCTDSARTIRVEVANAADRAVVRVLDRGPGIAASLHERVFERFYRVQQPGHEHVVGTGLGLALVRELAVLHGGTARVVDRPGGGCVVEVHLPRATAPQSVEEGVA